MSDVLIPLIGGTGPERKRPAVQGWNQPDYRTPVVHNGSTQWPHEGWVGLRADGLVIIDCDSDEAYARWIAHAGDHARETLTRQTPRGYHLFYGWNEKPLGPRANILGPGSGVDIRSGPGSYVVLNAPGYSDYAYADRTLQPWNPQWFVLAEAKAKADQPAEGWREISQGARDATLFGIASDMRGRGASAPVILRALAALNAVCDPPMAAEDLKRIAKSAGSYEAGNTILLVDDDDVVDTGADIDRREGRLPRVTASSLKLPEAPTFLWDPFILDGHATMLEGREGIGKGLLAAFLATMVAKRGQGVLWFVAEDDIRHDLLPRLIAAGWDRDKDGEISFIPPSVAFSLPKHSPLLLNEVESGDFGLVIFDPIKSFAGQVDGFDATGNSDMYVRKVYEPVSHAAMKAQVPIITIGHWNKGAGSTQNASLGSVAWRAVPRQVVQLAGRRTGDGGALWLGKSNVSAVGHVTEYAIKVRPVQFADEVRDVPFFELGESLDFETLDEYIEWEKGNNEPEDPKARANMLLLPSVEEVEAALRQVYPPGAKILLTRDKVRATLNDLLVRVYSQKDGDRVTPIFEKVSADFAADMREQLIAHGVLTGGQGKPYTLSPLALEAS